MLVDLTIIKQIVYIYKTIIIKGRQNQLGKVLVVLLQIQTNHVIKLFNKNQCINP